MAIRFTCPCGLTLEAEDRYAGQSTVCPQCGRQKKIPSPGKPPVAKLLSPSPPPKAPPPAADSGFEVIEDDEPVVAAPKARPRPALTMRGEEDDRPVRRKKSAEPVDDARPRKRPRDEDEDDRPRKRKSRKKKLAPSGNASARLWKILGGVAFLLAGIGLLVLWKYSEGRRTTKLLIWGIIAVVLGLGGIGVGMFGTVDSDSHSDDDEDYD